MDQRDQQQQSRWRPTRRQLLWAGSIVGVVAVLLLIRLGYTYPWTGFGKSKVNEAVQPAKTLWDWLGLLIVPVVLAIGGYFFTRSESRATREAAERRAQDETLQAYLDRGAPAEALRSSGSTRRRGVDQGSQAGRLRTPQTPASRAPSAGSLPVHGGYLETYVAKFWHQHSWLITARYASATPAIRRRLFVSWSAMEQGPLLVSLSRLAGHIKPQLAAVTQSRPTAASGSSCRTVPGTLRSYRRRCGRRRYLAPRRACRWEGCS